MDRPNELQFKIHEIIDRIRELRLIEGLTEADMPGIWAFPRTTISITNRDGRS